MKKINRSGDKHDPSCTPDTTTKMAVPGTPSSKSWKESETYSLQRMATVRSEAPASERALSSLTLSTPGKALWRSIRATKNKPFFATTASHKIFKVKM